MNYSKILTLFFELVILMFTGAIQGCESLLDVDASRSLVTRETVFGNDITAEAAMTGIYASMVETGAIHFANGTQFSVTALCGMSGDEIEYFSSNAAFRSFQDYSISPENSSIGGLWRSLYFSIYRANSVYEGVSQSRSITDSVSAQIRGEALFVRAFCHYYLVMLFGDVPLILETNYENNSYVTRSAVSDVLSQVVSDLKAAKELLLHDYVVAERIRPNKAVASALLSRVYLHMERWNEAAIEASALIDDNRFRLEKDLSIVFRNESRETIWQLKPEGLRRNTNEGNLFILTAPPTSSSSPFCLSNSLLSAFEQGDARFANWIKSISKEEAIFYFPFKYKIKTGGATTTPPVALQEYSVVLRLSEQYLIRAEARIRQGLFDQGITDIDSVRVRAGLQTINETMPGVDADGLLHLVSHERLVELFSEWGHRWIDLKRMGRANEVLNMNEGWDETDGLYPIPRSEFDRNPELGLQNDGY